MTIKNYCWRQVWILAYMLLAAGCAFAQEPWKDAPLFDAVAAGKINVIEAALASGRNPNTRSPYWGSLLQYASSMGQIEIVKLLLAKGADPKAEGNEGLLLGAIKAQRMEILMVLVDAGAWVAKPAGAKYRGDFLVEAASASNREMVEYLLAHGADLNGKGPICKESALEVAAMNGDVDIMAHLINAGLDVNYRDLNGWTALMYACKEGKVDAVKYLLARGADAAIKDGYNRTAGTMASSAQVANTQELRVLCSGGRP